MIALVAFPAYATQPKSHQTVPDCPLWSDIKSKLPNSVHWETLKGRSFLGAQIMWAMAPNTPTELPDATAAYLGTIDGKDMAMLVFSKADYQVCLPPMRVEKDGLKLLRELQSGKGDDL